ncbi:MAG: PrsW family intramembrane metalloprotease [Rhodothermales bacterium]|nr:PrsW family intramembrane metalloprotease [Rhodothermales bacterium]
MLFAVHVLIAVLPVAVFLAALVMFDSYKLLPFRLVIGAVVAGLLAAVAAYYVNGEVASLLGLSDRALSRYAAPVVEEILKGGFLLYLVYSDRVGFPIDAAIAGFAAGAGFAALENMYYLSVLGDAGTQIWVVRGFGTAVMHGTTTAVLAMIARTLLKSQEGIHPLPALAGLGASIVLHAVYNHFPLGVMEGTLFLLVSAPLLLSVVFVQSERSLQQWLGTGFDTDKELLDLLLSGRVSGTRMGEYLASLKEHFEPAVVADMLCLIRIRVELSLRAKGILMMREAGFDTPVDDAVVAKFEELAYLEDAIGATGLLALKPIHRWSRRELWQMNLLES